MNRVMNKVMQPLSEDFLYASPERLRKESFRWVVTQRIRRLRDAADPRPLSPQDRRDARD